MPEQIVIGIITLFIFFVAHLVVWRLKSKGKGVTLITVIAALSYSSVAAFYGVFLKYKPSEHAWVSLPFCMFVIILYLHFYVGVERSVSVRILGELVKSKGGLTMERLRSIYPVERMFDHRVELLTEKKWLELRDGRYYCRPKAKWLSVLAIGLKKAYRLETTG